MRFPHGPGFGMFGGIIQDVIVGLFFLVCLAVVIALLVVIVRFLLVATRAAEIYIAKNNQPRPLEPVAPAAATPTPVAPVSAPRAHTAKPPTAK
jgi:uncharacterized membrane protein